jgi:thiamine-phosphate pyrophosphorylase
LAETRLHLVVPPIDALLAAECLEAACAAGDVASILVPDELVPTLMPVARRHDCTLIARGLGAARTCDGIEIADAEAYDTARRQLGKEVIVGAYCGTSRQLAMELAEAGADYIALAQAKDHGEEPILAWWSALFEVPCIAADPVAAKDVAALLTHNPDFIRPDTAMWISPAEARRIVAATMKALTR